MSSRGGVAVIVGIQVQKDSGAKGRATQTGSEGPAGDSTSAREAALSTRHAIIPFASERARARASRRCDT